MLPSHFLLRLTPKDFPLPPPSIVSNPFSKVTSNPKQTFSTTVKTNDLPSANRSPDIRAPFSKVTKHLNPSIPKPRLLNHLCRNPRECSAYQKLCPISYC
ncbi:hypothetical protein GWI33_020821 [Rhynchophorus ferrugineus]|uniref:Uncharacterized protein n=1 Tax=Rhynchophorus ferrugineus TaxID=354439 RepID=A0A834M045_RHYFE|nr:hypothetical protein GWI33_020821 [Rhynchophorus ferrugineus]